MGLVCSKLFRDLFYKINITTYDMEEFISRVRDGFGEIARVYGIGRCTEAFTAPKTPFNVNGINTSVVLYNDENGFDERAESFRFRTGEGGSLEVCFYPQNGKVWNGEELDDLAFIAENLFILGGRVQMLSVMKRISTTDIGTGASNMNGLSMHCEELLAKNLFKNYNMIFMNLKNFKFINRIVGEKQADMILKGYTQKLLGFIKEDERVARPGGDNFCALIRKDRMEEFLSFISSVYFETQDAGGKHNVIINSRAGIFEIKEGDLVNDAIDSASTALTTAKITGRCDIIWFEDEMLNKTIKANAISSIFPEALRNEEFVVYYQPKVSLSDNQLCGCEALTRWIKDGKVISPADFIPVLEREGTICRLDFYVLDKVCADVKRWLETGLNPVRVSTNFSKLHLHNEGFAEDIINIINKHGVNPSYIEVELTESSGYEDYEALAEFVRRMKSYGVSTSIDDFGTGYSSLNLLKDLDVDIIKLDKSFLDNLGDDKKTDEVVIRHIVNMVNELDMKVVAEGVETNIQADLLETFSCSMAQGYLFDKPLPYTEFEERLKNNRAYADIRN
ncbi:MAG: GGDEF domain-containing protein [Oscillospiraceae bacterium]|nr:GGDEF domain-containing protein [Oscillospiraceae bacterium]